MADAPTKGARQRTWWLIVAIYFVLFAATGYVAFIAHIGEPTLQQQTDALTASVSDQQTRAVVGKMLQDEAAEHELKTEMAAHAFHVILGALLGFLSASAVFMSSRRDE